MTLQHSGKLLVKVPGRSFDTLFATAAQLLPTEYRVETLFKARVALPSFDATAPGDHWLLANPTYHRAEHPWDEAHRVAAATGYEIYAEPDLLHALAPPTPVCSD